MSIYSGFATRQQEELYSSYVEALIGLLQKRILRLYRCEQTDEAKFGSTLRKIHGSMHKMESHKYLEPKLSTAFGELVGHFAQQARAGGLDAISRSDGHSISHIADRVQSPAQLAERTPEPVVIKEQARRAGTADAFRIKRPAKYSSSARRPFSEEKHEQPRGLPNNPNDDDSIREVLDQCLTGRNRQRLSKAQKGYLRFFKRQKNSLGEALQLQDKRSLARKRDCS